MPHPHRRSLIIVLLALVVWLLPSPAWADGPIPPRGPFWSPPTPTPAPLPTSTPSPTPDYSPLRDLPGEDQTIVFIPLVSHRTVLRAVVTGDQHDPFQDSFVYQVQAGDTLSDLAIEFGRDQRTLSCTRDLVGAAVTELHAGDQIVIPAMDSLCHRVKQGDTLTGIATWYGVDADSLTAEPGNQQLLQEALRAGQYLLVPGARSRYRAPDEINLTRSQSTDWFYGDGNFIWPIDRSLIWVSQRFRHGKHMAIDIAANAGAEVKAADTGKVLKAGWSDNGYGYRIVIDHGIDYITLYAHLSEYYVQPGDIVAKGDVIGIVGSTGHSTGPHLHFEVRDYGYLIDPLLVLR